MSPSYAVAFQNAPEQHEPVDLTIKGTIPPWLHGVLYRTGPGTYQIPLSKDSSKHVAVQHWFDGLSMNHRFEIHPGGQRVSYRSRKSSDDYEQSAADQGFLPGINFGQRQSDICETIFEKFFTVFQQPTTTPTPSSENVGVTITPDMPGWKKVIDGLPAGTLSHEHKGPKYIVAKTDANVLQLLDPVSLEPLSIADYGTMDPRLDGELSAAHSCHDLEADEFYNYTCKLGPSPTYKVFQIKGSSGEVDILAEITDAPPAYLHSLALTSKYVVLIVWQAHITGNGLPILNNHKSIAEAIEKKWDPSLDSIFYVIDRKEGGIVATYKTPPFFCFHQLNAFDDPNKDDIILDMAVFEDHAVIDRLYLDKLRNLDADNHMLMGRARRFRLTSVTTGPESTRQANVEFTLQQDACMELPTINPGNYLRPYRYAYGINKLDPREYHTFADRIVKVDMDTPEGGHIAWQVPGYTPSEPIFVPRPGAQDEDDGIVLSVVLDGEKVKSMLVILDAKDLKELARAEMETVYPIGFHGVFTPIQV
ncbi:hypothetical protein AAF712_008782 [Marasmius tenuissimus]|uniref:Carotenoid oxygenase n=1 Tax=Marasmius tenuissimus TaxID=585030 RepID=A0ABR2ZT84_9AGAR